MKRAKKRSAAESASYASPKAVDLLNDIQDFTIAMMVELGQSTRAIMNRTGYTFCQVTYRVAKLKKAGITRADYRDGKSATARDLFRKHAEWVEGPLKLALQKAGHKWKPL